MQLSPLCVRCEPIQSTQRGVCWFHSKTPISWTIPKALWYSTELHWDIFLYSRFNHQYHFKRGRHLKFSVANWKNRPTSFDLLRKVVRGQVFGGHLLTPRWVRQNPDVPPTLAPNLMFQWTVLSVQNWPKNCWPWMTFLSRSNTGRRFFQFATEEFKCRPLLNLRKNLLCFLSLQHGKHDTTADELKSYPPISASSNCNPLTK